MAQMPAETGAGRASTRPGPSEPATLSDGAAKWIEQLPQHVQPSRTAARFPHIVNAFAECWSAPQRCRDYFEQLLIDRRGDRLGFPKPIASELAALKDYYDSVVHPTQQTVWDEIVSLARR
jgi:hypothetical protein